MKAAVTGATGFIGAVLCRKPHGRGGKSMSWYCRTKITVTLLPK